MVGTMPLVARHLYADGVGAPSMLLWRYAIALIALAAAAKAADIDLRRAWRRGAWAIVLVGATLGTAQTLCYWESIKTLDTSIAVMLFYTYPAITLVLDRVFFKQPIRLLAVLCIGAILAGVGLIMGPGVEHGTLDPRGLMWAVPGPLIYSVYLAITARLLRRHPPLIGAMCLFGGMAVSFGLAAMFLGLDVPAGPRAWGLILFIGLGPGALWMMLFTFSAPRLGASSFAILANTELITVVLVGVTVLGERVTLSRAIGGGLIVAGILVHALARQAPHPGPLAASGERKGPAPAGAGD